jgi:hypothetical protein
VGGPLSWAAVGVGAAIGAWLRWGLSLWLAGWHAHVPLGTLAANLVGGYLVGIALAFFASYPSLSPEWRLFAITGFLGRGDAAAAARPVQLGAGARVIAPVRLDRLLHRRVRHLARAGAVRRRPAGGRA